MSLINKTLITILLCLSAAAEAATEFVRLEGSISPDYSGPSLPEGLYPGQFLYFDIEFDLELNPNGQPDTENINGFVAGFVNGNYAINIFNGWAGSDASGYIYRAFNMAGPLGIVDRRNCNFAQLPPECLNPLEFDWVVGSEAQLLFTDLFDTVATLTVTYRGSAPPPPIPLPAGIWLFLSALGATVGLRKISGS